MKTINQFSGIAQHERGSARMILLALVSFSLGVAATAAWFQLAANRQAANSNPQAASQPAVSESAEAPAAANVSPQSFVEKPVPVSADAVAEVKQALPNYASLSLDNGIGILRQVALKKFADATAELQTEVGKAQQQLADAENSQSASDQQAAMKHLQEVQAEQTAKLQKIAGELQTQIAALKQLKSGQQ